jgi:hypothetical protein
MPVQARPRLEPERRRHRPPSNASEAQRTIAAADRERVQRPRFARPASSSSPTRPRRRSSRSVIRKLHDGTPQADTSERSVPRATA